MHLKSLLRCPASTALLGVALLLASIPLTDASGNPPTRNPDSQHHHKKPKYNHKYTKPTSKQNASDHDATLSRGAPLPRSRFPPTSSNEELGRAQYYPGHRERMEEIKKKRKEAKRESTLVEESVPSDGRIATVQQQSAPVTPRSQTNDLRQAHKRVSSNSVTTPLATADVSTDPSVTLPEQMLDQLFVHWSRNTADVNLLPDISGVTCVRSPIHMTCNITPSSANKPMQQIRNWLLAMATSFRKAYPNEVLRLTTRTATADQTGSESESFYGRMIRLAIKMVPGILSEAEAGRQIMTWYIEVVRESEQGHEAVLSLQVPNIAYQGKRHD